MNTALIYEYCNVIEEVFLPVHAIYFEELGDGYAKIEDEDGEIYDYSCGSLRQFQEILEMF